MVFVPLYELNGAESLMVPGPRGELIHGLTY